jgi:hypothetical protein
VTRGIALERRAVQRAGGGLGRQQVGGAHLHARRAQRHGRGHAVGIGNAAGRDHRYLQRAHQLRQQREGAELLREVVRQEVAAMPARLEPLRDDGVGAVRFEPQRFFHRGGRGQHLGAPAAHLRQQRLWRKPEMKAHHRRTKLAQQVGHVGAEGVAARAGGNARRVDAELGVVRRQRGAPCGLAVGAGVRRRVAEEVDVVRFAGARADGGQLAAQGVGAQHGAGQRAECAGVAHRDGHRAALHAGHRRLDEGKFGAQKLLQRGHREGAPVVRFVAMPRILRPRRRSPRRQGHRPRASAE